LSQNLKTRIANIGYLFGEIYPFTLEESIKNFKFDLNPEMEIERREAFARIYIAKLLMGRGLVLEINVIYLNRSLKNLTPIITEE
jgi:hypothetical protein